MPRPPDPPLFPHPLPLSFVGLPLTPSTCLTMRISLSLVPPLPLVKTLVHAVWGCVIGVGGRVEFFRSLLLARLSLPTSNRWALRPSAAMDEFELEQWQNCNDPEMRG